MCSSRSIEPVEAHGRVDNVPDPCAARVILYWKNGFQDVITSFLHSALRQFKIFLEVFSTYFHSDVGR